MKVGKLEVLKVTLENEYYVLIMPNFKEGVGIRDFFLAHELFGDVMWMFGCYVKDDEDAIRLAVSNAEDVYIPKYREGLGR